MNVLSDDEFQTPNDRDPRPSEIPLNWLRLFFVMMNPSCLLGTATQHVVALHCAGGREHGRMSAVQNFGIACMGPRAVTTAPLRSMRDGSVLSCCSCADNYCTIRSKLAVLARLLARF